MPQTVVLAVGLDSTLLSNRHSVWQPAGYYITPAHSISEAIAHFTDGDYDLVLLGHSIPAESRERLTFLVRASGSSVPIVCIANSSSLPDSFADATFRSEPDNLLHEIGELLAQRVKMPPVSTSTSRARR